MVATVRLLTGSKRHEVGLLHFGEIHSRPRGRKDRNIDRVVAAFLRRQRRVPQHVVGTERTEGNLLLDRQLVHGQRSGLVAAQHIDAGELLNRREARHNCPLQ
jgi:hypothetical protein